MISSELKNLGQCNRHAVTGEAYILAYLWMRQSKLDMEWKKQAAM